MDAEVALQPFLQDMQLIFHLIEKREAKDVEKCSIVTAMILKGYRGGKI